MLERLHTRLKIVSDIDSNDNANWLWSISQNPRNETEGTLASLVLSYNMLPKHMERSRKEILNQISTLLNVNSAVRRHPNIMAMNRRPWSLKAAWFIPHMEGRDRTQKSSYMKSCTSYVGL